MTTRKDYGPVQLATFLGLKPWQFSRAREAALIPAPDRPRSRWSGEAACAALARIGDIVLAVGAIPDLGAVRAAEILSARLGVTVTADDVAELSRRGLLPVADYYKDWPLFDGRAIEAFADPDAAEEASRAGNLLIADDATSYLRIRRCDFGHLIRAGLLKPADWGHGPWDRRDRFSVPLYRTGDLDALAPDPAIDWEAVRATPRGHRSPLAALPATLGGRRGPGRRTGPTGPRGSCCRPSCRCSTRPAQRIGTTASGSATWSGRARRRPSVL